MNNVLIKICGIRDPKLAQQATQAGAHFIGLIFHPPSKRYVSIDQAQTIATATLQAGAKPVAVFVDHTAEEMQTICDSTNIRIVQLHGKTAREQHHLLPNDYQRIYVIPMTEEISTTNFNQDNLKHCNPKRDFLLFDHPNAGLGKRFNWDKFHYTGDFRFFIAGGLTPNNVNTAIQQLMPDAIDVSSGVENKLGGKEITLIKKFIATAKK